LERSQIIILTGVAFALVGFALVFSGIMIILSSSESNPNYLFLENLSPSEQSTFSIQINGENNIVTFLSVKPPNNLVQVSVVSESGVPVWEIHTSEREKRFEFNSIAEENYDVTITNLGKEPIIFNGYFFDELSPYQNSQTIKEIALDKYDNLLLPMSIGFLSLIVSVIVSIVGTVFYFRDKKRIKKISTRPAGITLLIYLNIVMIPILAVISYLDIQYPVSFDYDTTYALSTGNSIVDMIITLSLTIATIGLLLYRKPFARLVIMSFSIFGIIQSILIFSTNRNLDGATDFIFVMVDFIIIWYMFRPNVIQYFKSEKIEKSYRI